MFAIRGTFFRQVAFSFLVLIYTIGCGQQPEPPQETSSHSPSESNGAAGLADESSIGSDTPAAVIDATEDEPGDPKEPPPADFTVSHKDFMAEKNADRDKWMAKYQGKWVEIGGPVLALHAPLDAFGDNNPGVQMAQPTDDSNPLSFLNFDGKSLLMCETPGSHPWLHANRGDRITVRGKLSSLGHLVDGSVVSAEGSPVEQSTAEDLANAYADSPEAAEKTYENMRYVILSGKVARNGIEETCDDHKIYITLEGTDDLEVGLHHAGASASPQFKSLKAGDALTVLGECIVIVDPSAGELSLAISDAKRIASPTAETP